LWGTAVHRKHLPPEGCCLKVMTLARGVSFPIRPLDRAPRRGKVPPSKRTRSRPAPGTESWQPAQARISGASRESSAATGSPRPPRSPRTIFVHECKHLGGVSAPAPAQPTLPLTGHQTAVALKASSSSRTPCRLRPPAARSQLQMNRCRLLLCRPQRTTGPDCRSSRPETQRRSTHRREPADRMAQCSWQRSRRTSDRWDTLAVSDELLPIGCMSSSPGVSPVRR
jgi:hypothetical protein